MKVFHYCNATVIAAKEPFQVELVEGKKYSWCKCGLSKKQVTSYAYKDELTVNWPVKRVLKLTLETAPLKLFMVVDLHYQFS